MLSDIVERLRAIGGYFDKAAIESGVTCYEVANEIELRDRMIERLRQQVQELQAELACYRPYDNWKSTYLELIRIVLAEIYSFKLNFDIGLYEDEFNSIIKKLSRMAEELK